MAPFFDDGRPAEQQEGRKQAIDSEGMEFNLARLEPGAGGIPSAFVMITAPYILRGTTASDGP